MDENIAADGDKSSLLSSDSGSTRSQEQDHEMQPTREELLAHVRAQPGTALVKAEFIDFSKVSERFKAKHGRKKADEDTESGKRGGGGDGASREGSEPPTKKQKVRGQNKRRPRDKHTQPGDRPCLDFLRSATCRFGESCKYSHDIKKLVANKPPDIRDKCVLFETFGRCQYGVLCRFGSAHIDADLHSVVNEDKVKVTGGQPTVLNTLTKDLQIKLRKRTFHFKKYDQYMKSLKANKSSKNVTNVTSEKRELTPKDMNMPKQVSSDCDSKPAEVSQSVEKAEKAKNIAKDNSRSQGLNNVASSLTGSSTEGNESLNSGSVLNSEGTDASAPSIKGETPSSAEGSTDKSQVETQERTSKVVGLDDLTGSASQVETGSNSSSDMPAAAGGVTGNGDAVAVGVVTSDANHAGAITDEDTIRTRMAEKKKLDVEGKLLLAPLTTVGNLPFRAVCKKLGADITCGEMAMCTNLLQGQTSEWALLKRHPSEDVFGVQLCGAFPDTMTKCAELLNHTIDIDFVDINVGCPIDLVYHKGAGSGLMNRMGKFQEIVRGMSSVLDIPLTVKMRTGVHEGALVAHKLIPRIYDWGASVVTVHGRTREQRYTKLADWSYLGECAQAADPYPFIGNGDILSYEDANFFRQQSGSSGLMIARGALIKPWLFTEIKEQRHWDISSRERLDILQEYVNLGLMHWGTDTEGVSKTRRFLLEWLSFLHRYIPVGLLERLPQKINERPPYFVGRDNLETLMASANCNDWLKISEMLLGPAPEDFQFLPKHKANSYK